MRDFLKSILVGAVLLGAAGALPNAVLADDTPAKTPAAIDLESPGAAAQNPAKGAPAIGANSFVEGQAKALIESKGYVDVSPLMNDKQGVWRGTASKNGARVHVSVDYKGHVDEQQ